MTSIQPDARNGEEQPLSVMAAVENVEDDTSVSHQGQDQKDSDEAPDSGYGWVIVFSSFMIQTLVSFPLAYGVFYVELLDVFGRSNSDTAWPGSLAFGLSLAAGPLASILCNKIGHRLTCIVGGVVSAIGVFASAFVNDLDILNVTFGVLTGVGMSMSYVAGVVMVGFYFKKRLSMANGLAVSGVGFGEMVFPPLLKFFIDTYTWRGGMILTAGILLNLIILGALLRPIKRAERLREKSTIFEVSLFKDWKFFLCVIIDILWNIGSLAYTALIVDHAVLQGIDGGLAALLPTFIGGGALIGKLFIAFATGCKCCNHLLLYGVATLMSAVPLFCPLLNSSYGALVSYSLFYGYWFGIQLGLLPVITVELFGLQRLTSAYGYLMFGDGVGCIIGPPIGGFLFDLTNTYTTSFIFGGVVSVVAGILIMVIVIARCLEGDGMHVIFPEIRRASRTQPT